MTKKDCVIKAIAELKEQGVTLDVVLEAIAEYADLRADWNRVVTYVKEAAKEVQSVKEKSLV